MQTESQDNTATEDPKKKERSPQEGVDRHWKKFFTKCPGKVTSILPDNPHARTRASKTPVGAVQGERAIKSYNEAYAECKRDVERIIRECRRTNHKYRDPHFDIELDLKLGNKDCLYGLNRRDHSLRPKGVKRVTEIFESPQFFVKRPSSEDVRQGHDGDCWFMAALSALGTKEGLIEKVCVAHDADVGVYGFVFHRDGEWQQCIVDDKLYLRVADYYESVEEKKIWNKIDRKAEEDEYIKAYQTGSRALYFASCSDENATWLPLLEKAYAKIHGDYLSIEMGFVGEGIEDLTGGVTSEIYSTDILDKERFWEEQLSQVNEKFLFGCSTGHLANWLDPDRCSQNIKGIVQKHAYSIIDAKFVKGKRLVKLRNPWAEVEWTGPWSDGSKEWTPEWMHLLDHKFGDDGVFWMSYDDLLRKYQHFDRTRLFDESWTISQLWTTLDISWSSADYHSTKFSLTLLKKSEVVIVLSQLDSRYWKDLQGQYTFTLSFRLHRDGADEDDYLVRSHGNIAMKRSVSTDIELEPGTYSVLMKIIAWRDEEEETPEDVIREYAYDRPDKLMALGFSYDLAHAKGRVVETEEEKKERLQFEAHKKSKEKAKRRAKAEKQRRKEWEVQKKKAARAKRQHAKEMRVNARRAAKANATRRSSRSEFLPPHSRDYRYPRDMLPVEEIEVVEPPATMPTLVGKETASTHKNTEGSSEQHPQDEPKTQTTESETQSKPVPTNTPTGSPVPGEEPHESSSTTMSHASPEAVSPSVDIEEDVENRPIAGIPPTVASSTSDDSYEIVSANRNGLHTEQSPETSEPPTDRTESADTVGGETPSEIEAKHPASGVITSDKPDEPPVGANQEHESPRLATAEDSTTGPRSEGTAATAPEAKEAAGVSASEVTMQPPAPPRAAASSGSGEMLFDFVDDISDTDSFPDFEFDSDLDMPIPPPPPPPEQQSKKAPPPPPQPDSDGEDHEPWNAVCVVGLQVYSQVKDADVTLRVIRPKKWEHEIEPVLDRDDPAKGGVKAEA